MAGKKDRSRFSIKFNENDPAHEKTIGILEKQGQRKIAPFIVNAVLHYINCPEVTNVVQGGAEYQNPVADRSYIEAIVADILVQQGILHEISEQKEDQKGYRRTGTIQKRENSMPAEEREVQMQVDETVRAMITSSMSAFRNK